METWSNFFVAVAGAAATLAGLIFVGVSINLTKILSIKKLPNRALASLVLLIIILILSILFLVPEQSITAKGIEVLVIGILNWIIILSLDMSIYKNTRKEYRVRHLLNIIFSQLSTLPYIIAGIFILNSGLAGIYWIVPGIIFSFFKSVSDAWVLLVEINR